MTRFLLALILLATPTAASAARQTVLLEYAEVDGDWYLISADPPITDNSVNPRIVANAVVVATTKKAADALAALTRVDRKHYICKATAFYMLKDSYPGYRPGISSLRACKAQN